MATLDNALAAHVAFDLERPAAVALISRVARETGRWREHFEDGSVPVDLIDRLAGAFRRLDDVASAECATNCGSRRSWRSRRMTTRGPSPAARCARSG